MPFSMAATRNGSRTEMTPLPPETATVDGSTLVQLNDEPTGTDNGSTGSTCTDEDQWLGFELDRISVRTQTLDEILAEKGEFLLPEEEEEDPQQQPAEGGGEWEGAGAASLGASTAAAQLAPMGRYGAQSTELPNSYQLQSPLRVQRADAISHQIASVLERPEGGKPTALCVGKDLVAVGTARGLCMLFEKSTQKLAHFVHADKAFGSVSCLDFSQDQTRLCAGFGQGGVLVMECTRGGRTLFQANDLVQPGRGILHVKYVNSFSLLLVDSGGNVYEFHERRRRRKQDNVRCLFTGSRGEVTNIVFVHTADVELLVLVTFHQVLLLSTRRSGAPLGQLRLHGSPLWPALIDWRKRELRLNHTHLVRELRLCVGREREVRVYQVRQRVGGDLLFQLERTVQVPGAQPLLNLKWLDNWALLALTGGTGGDGEQLLLLELLLQQQRDGGDKKTQQRTTATLVAAEQIGQRIRLVYASADFKALATGRNVSEAMYRLAESVCFHSVARHSADDCVYVLGWNGLFQVSLLDQAEQLDALIKKQEICSALLFAVDVCNGRVRDRTKSGVEFRSRASRMIPALVAQLLDGTIDGLDSGHIDELVAHYKRNIYVMLCACTATSHFELLYETVYAQLQKDSLCRPIFLELLEEFVLEGQLDLPPPALVNDYLGYLLAEGQLPQFEQSVTRLPVECMDLHQVMTVCLQNQLFDGFCHVMNNAMRDYVGPLKEMFDHLQRFVHKEVLSDCEIAQGNKLLLYLSCCLAGRAYPFGELPDEHLSQTVPLETYKFLVQLRPKFTIAGDSPSPPPEDQFENDGGADRLNVQSSGNPAFTPSLTDLRFPHIQLLLKLDAQQFLNVISTCADAPVFAQSEGRLKRLVDLLIAKCVEGEDEPNELGPLLVRFVVALLQKGAIPRDPFLFTQLVERVLERRFPNARAQEQAEHAIVELLKAMPEDLELERILRAAQPLPYVHICAYIFGVRHQYVELLECCLADPIDPKAVFPILGDLLVRLRDSQLDALRQFVQRQLARLSALSPSLSAQLVLGHMPTLLVEHRHSPRALSAPFLHECFSLRREQGLRTLSGGDEEQDELFFDTLFEQTIERAVSDNSLDRLDAELTDLLRYWLPLGSLSDHCLNVAMQQHQKGGVVLLESTAILLVVRGHVQRAFEHLFHQGIVPSEHIPTAQKDRCIYALLELAQTHVVEACRGEWLLKLLRHLLADEADRVQKDGGHIGALAQSFRPESHLARVFTAIMEQQEEASSGEEDTGMVLLVAELFSHPLLRNASFRSFQPLLSQMLLWCEIRVLIQRATRDCVRRELADRFARDVYGKGTRPAFACSVDEWCPQPMASAPASQQQRRADEEDPPLHQGSGLCFCCVQRISKSFYLFPCGHCVHLECVELMQTHKKCPCGGREQRRRQEEQADAPVRDTEGRADERSAASAIFRHLEHNFELWTGPPPPSRR